MRDRLIAILDEYGDNISFCDICDRPTEDCEACKNEQLADYLLANGVIVPPCKVGDIVYRTMVYNDKLVSWKIVKMEVFEDEMGFVDDSNNWIAFEDIGKTVFLTREEAERALKGRVKRNKND